MSYSERIHVLGVVGSARRGGNTEILVDEVLRGAEAAGATVEKLLLGKFDIRPCLACDHCRRTGECGQHDDMAPLLEKVKQSQVYVFGTPVYFMGPSGQLKTFIDRWYALGPDGRETILNGRRVILAIPMESTDICMAHHTVGMLSEMTSWGGMERFASIVVPGADKRGQVRDYPRMLELAYRAGFEVLTQ
jgi:multimeric flavodoxin WrbA